MTTDYDFIAARWAIFDAPIPGPLKLVALVLVEHMPNCHPSVSKIASMCGTERKTAIRALARLERMGVISVERRNGALNQYAFRPVPFWRTGPSGVPVPEEDGTGPNEGMGPVPTATETGPSEVPKAGVSRKEAGERRGRARGLELAAAGASKPDWSQYPAGWTWSNATEAEASMQGVTVTQLREHVDYWSRHKFARPCTDLEAELRARIPDIRKRAEKDRFRDASDRSKAPAVTSTNQYGWHPKQTHRELCKAHGRDLDFASTQYRGAGTPERLPSTLAADDDFTRRLRHWFSTGSFIPAGKLPRRQPVDSDRSKEVRS
jgi:hypothetical protein